MKFVVLIDHINKIMRVLEERLIAFEKLLFKILAFLIDVILQVYILYFVFVFYFNIRL